MTAILATFADFKLVKSRAVAQLVFEVPVEQADAALTALGGLPRADLERWAGIAPLDKTAVAARHADGGVPHAPVKGGDKPGHSRRQFTSLPRSQQAAMRCDDYDFQVWLGVVGTGTDAALKARLAITSKKELDTDPEAAKRWDTLLNEYLDSRLPERR